MSTDPNLESTLREIRAIKVQLNGTAAAPAPNPRPSEAQNALGSKHKNGSTNGCEASSNENGNTIAKDSANMVSSKTGNGAGSATALKQTSSATHGNAARPTPTFIHFGSRDNTHDGFGGCSSPCNRYGEVAQEKEKGEFPFFLHSNVKEAKHLVNAVDQVYPSFLSASTPVEGSTDPPKDIANDTAPSQHNGEDVESTRSFPTGQEKHPNPQETPVEAATSTIPNEPPNRVTEGSRPGNASASDSPSGDAATAATAANADVVKTNGNGNTLNTMDTPNMPKRRWSWLGSLGSPGSPDGHTKEVKEAAALKENYFVSSVAPAEPSANGSAPSSSSNDVPSASKEGNSDLTPTPAPDTSASASAEPNAIERPAHLRNKSSFFNSLRGRRSGKETVTAPEKGKMNEEERAGSAQVPVIPDAQSKSRNQEEGTLEQHHWFDKILDGLAGRREKEKVVPPVQN